MEIVVIAVVLVVVIAVIIVVVVVVKKVRVNKQYEVEGRKMEDVTSDSTGSAPDVHRSTISTYTQQAR